jgi:hypothetical protein
MAHSVGRFTDNRGYFCRQTAGGAIDTVINSDEILRPRDGESNSGRATALAVLLKKKSVQRELSATDRGCVSAFQF